MMSKQAFQSVRILGKPIHIKVEPGCGIVEAAANRICYLVENKVDPRKILALVPSREFAKKLRNGIDARSPDLEHPKISTPAQFCSEMLNENPFEAGVDPRFRIMPSARKRIIARQIVADIVGKPQIEALVLDLLDHFGVEGIRDAVLSIRNQQARDMPYIQPTDPIEFLTAFERCFMELVTCDWHFDESIEQVIENLKNDFSKVLAWMDMLAHEFDWKTYNRLKRYRGRFRPPKGNTPFHQIMQGVRSAFSDFLASCIDRESRIYADLLLEIADEFHRRFALLKSNQGLLDYDEITILASGLLANQDMVDLYRSRFDSVIVCKGERGNPLYDQIPQRLFQPKIVCISDNVNTRGSANKKNDHLRWNFKSADGIVAFTNYLFGKVFDEESDSLFEKIKSKGQGRNDPSVEIRLSPGYRNIEPRKRQECQAHIIAQRILELKDNHDFGDIVVMMRFSGEMHIYERIFNEYGIPTCMTSGRAIFNSTEGQDVLNLLRIAENPADDFSVAEVLLSPFIGITPEALALLCIEWPTMPHESSEGRLWRAIERLDEIPGFVDDERKTLLSFKELISELHQIRERVDVLHILDCAIEATKFNKRLLSMKNGRLRRSNLLRIREIARQFQGSLSDYIANIEDADTQIRDAPANAVNIMTIRNAKEVESPVVFLADISGSLRMRDRDFAIDSDGRMALTIRNAVSGMRENSLIHREIIERLRKGIVSEEKKTLYSALSCALDRLILVGCSDLTGEFNSTYQETYSWSGWIEKAFELGPFSPLGVIEKDDCKVDFSYQPPEIIKPDEELALTARFESTFAKGLPLENFDISPKAYHIAEKALENATFTPNIPPISRFSVTQILDYLDCPARYRYLHALGISEIGGEPDDTLDDHYLSPADIGILTHDILANLDFTHEIAPQIENLIAKIPNQEMAAHVEPLVKRFERSRWSAELQAADKIYKETPFQLNLHGAILTGLMDTLYRGKDGWVVLDYKTGRAEEKERYELQIGMYALVTRRLLGEMPAKACLLLLSLDDEWSADISDGSAANTALDKIIETANSIKEGRFEARKCKSCDWCSFNGMCGIS